MSQQLLGAHAQGQWHWESPRSGLSSSDTHLKQVCTVRHKPLSGFSVPSQPGCPAVLCWGGVGCVWALGHAPLSSPQSAKLGGF